MTETQTTNEPQVEKEAESTTFGKLAEGDFFQIPGDEQGRVFKRLPPQLGNLAANTADPTDANTDTFSPHDRVIPLS